MTNQLTVWHNPKCSKSRKTLELLEKRGFKPQVRRYLEDPPTQEELDQVLEALNLDPRELMRRREAEYEEMDLADAGRTHEELTRAMINNPVLIQRPVVLTSDGRAKLGRPPESVLSLFDED